MSLLFRIIYAAHARGTHHKLALDALRHLSGPSAEPWQRLFLKHAEVYMEGAKAPDDQFKDFKNHVLHVGDTYWGGAPEKAESWYLRLVETLAAESWSDAVYCAGILSHYYTDPIHPFHTGQTEAENNIHRAAEWSISRSYDQLKAIGEEIGAAAEPSAGSGPGWLRDLVLQGAETSHRHYETLIAHYDINKGVVDPPSGLDDVSRRIVGSLIVYAYRGFALVLDRAFKEAAIAPPEVTLTLDTVMAAIKIPRKALLKKLADGEDRRQVERMYDELKATGRVEVNLPEDDRMVRDLYRAEVLIPREAEAARARAQRMTATTRTGSVVERTRTVVVPAAAATILAPEVERAVRRAVERRTTERLTAQRTETRATATETTTTMQSHSEATTLGARLATLAATEAVRPVPSVRPATSLETVVLAPRRTIPAAPRVDGPAVQASVATDRTAAVARQTTTTERNATTESTLSRLGRSLIGDRDSTSAGWSGRWGNDQRSGLGGVTSLDAGATGVGEAAEVTSIGGGGETAGARIADRAAAASRSLGAARVVAVERGAQSVEADASLRSTSVTSSRVDTLTEIERREAALASFMQRDVMQRDVMHRDVTHRDALQRDMTVRAAAASSATSASTSTSSSTSTALTSKSASTSQTSTSSRSDTASTEVLASASSDETQSVPRIRRMARADDTVVMLRSRAEDTLVETDASDDESIDDTAFDDGDEASRSERARKRGTDGEMVRTARRRTRTSAERESGPRFYLSSSDDVVAAPSIGPKMAERLKALGVNTVADLLAADAETVAGCLDVRGVKTETVRDWQDQAKLVCDVPGLRGTHAQLLVGAGLRDLFAVADAEPATLLVAILRFAQTRDGERVLRSGEPPDLEKITTWVQNAVRAREARAA